jgi:uncharacterized membrane protein
MSTNEIKATQSRWTSKYLWVAIAAQIISLLQLTGAFAAMGLDAGVVGNTVAGLLQLLVVMGILNDPTSKETW